MGRVRERSGPRRSGWSGINEDLPAWQSRPVVTRFSSWDPTLDVESGRVDTDWD